MIKSHRFFLAAFLFFLPTFSFALTPSASAIASASPLATAAGMKMLQQGGNAFDAAIAVAAVLAVVEPYHSGIGGGGFWLLRDARTQKDIVLDSRERAPQAASVDMFLDAKGNAIATRALNGPLSAAIPGEPAALRYLAEHYAQLPLSQSLAPAIRIAEQGFQVDRTYQINAAIRLNVLREFPETAKIFLYQNQVPPLGYRIVQKDLANTLRAIAATGDPFYHGTLAKTLVQGVRAAGGLWQTEDLKTYTVKIRAPLRGKYHGIQIITVPPPSAGGVGLITMLNILSVFPLEKETSLMRFHHIIEAMRLAYWDRHTYLGDPDYVNIPIDTLLSLPHAADLRKNIFPDRATPSAQLPTVEVAQDLETHTTHFSILDQTGNRVAATLSINYIFGSGFVPAHTGVLLNDEMDDFSMKPGAANVFSVVGSKANAIAPGKRPLSSMTPTFLETDRSLAIVGTPGGSRIVTMMLLASLDFAAGHTPGSWVSLPRFHHQYLPDVVQYELEAFTPALKMQLQRMGYRLQRYQPSDIPADAFRLRDTYGNMQAILWDKSHNRVTAASDPRGGGEARVVGWH